MQRWVLPESIEDVLPAEAGRIEWLRRALLDAFELHGYQLVATPLLEYLDSLLTGSGRDLDLSTFKLVDQASGRMMGVRADITPQVARIDAHLLNRRGVARLCYCGSVLHTMPRMLLGTREPLQLGAEIYGHSGLEADIEIVRLLSRSLEIADLSASRIDLSHVGLFRALLSLAGLAQDLEEELFVLLQTKDLPGLRLRVDGVVEPVRSALLALPELYGGVEVLDRAAAQLPRTPEVSAALADLRGLASGLADLPISFDLADLRGFNYHSGVVFAAYCGGHPAAVALGGRYDRVGKAFGRGRAATGFSLDLRELARLVDWPAERKAILAPAQASAGLQTAVAELQASGEVVMVALPGHEGTWTEAGCDRQLVFRGGRWCVEPFDGE
jgi:ATP phosphoribosyltransferase regulatory subunit